MIVRLWRASVVEAHRKDFERIEEERLAPLLEQQAGFGGVLFLRQNEELTVMTLWDSRESAEKFNDSDAAVELTREVRERGYLICEPRVEVFEIHAGSFR